jgi:hypothetical protein
MKVAQNEQLTVVDQHVAERRMALQKTKQLHKQLDDMKPNAIFSSVVKRPTEDDPQDPSKRPAQTLTSPFTQLQKGLQSPRAGATQPGAGLRHTFVERPGQDDGFLIARQLANNKNQMFNSTSPRFNYDKQDSVMKEVPGPGSYDSTQHRTFNNLSDVTTSQFEKTYSIFKAETTKFEDLKGYRGYQRHQNITGPG